MKRLLTTLLLCLLPSLAQAASCSSYPFTLQNNTTADATQVMSNFNTVRNCVVNNAASNGINSDITALIGLTTPLAPTFGGSSVYVGGTSTGSANAQVISAPVPTSFSLTAGNQVNFKAGFSNTGATTLNVNGQGAVNLFKGSTSGPTALTGGEVVATNTVVAIYDGTQFILLTVDPSSAIPVGTSLNYRGFSAPAGFLLEGGQAVSRATYATLFGVITFTSTATTTSGSKIVTGLSSTTTLGAGMPVGGANITCGDTIASVDSPTQITLTTNNASSSGATTLTFAPYGVGNCSTTFNVPDSRGRMDAGNDNPTGGAGAAGRLTVVGSNCQGAVIGTGCGAQTTTIAQANLPSVSLSATLTISGNTTQVGANSGGVGSQPNWLASSTGTTPVSQTTSLSGTASGSVPLGGSGTAVATVSPLLVTQRMIKF